MTIQPPKNGAFTEAVGLGVDADALAPSDALKTEQKKAGDISHEDSEAAIDALATVSLGEVKPEWAYVTGRKPNGAAELARTHEPQSGESALVLFHPGKVALHESWAKTPLGAAMNGNSIDLNLISPIMIRRMDPTQLRVFLQCLKRLNVKVERIDPDGLRLTGVGKNERVRKALGKTGVEVMSKVLGKTSTENAAVAFARMIWASGHRKAFAKTFAAAPNAVLPMLNKSSARVVTAESFADILREMSSMKIAHGPEGAADKRGFTGMELHALGSLMAKFLEFNADKSAQSVKRSVEQLLHAVQQTGFADNTMSLGIVCGAIIAGVHKYFTSLKLTERDRKLMLSSFTNIVWAASALAGNVGTAVAIGLVSTTQFLMHRTKAEAQDIAAVCQGELLTRWLQHPPHHADKDGEARPFTRDEVQDAINWVSATIMSNRREAYDVFTAAKGRSAPRVRKGIEHVDANMLPVEVSSLLDDAELARK